MNIRLLLILVPLALVFCHQAHAQENSGFLKDYSVFTRTSEEGEVLLYIRDGAVERLAQYDSIMVDQPELFIDPDSNYKGMKPDTVTDIGEMIRSSVVDGLSGAYGIVEEPGESTLYLRLAATNLYIRKDKRGILGYTPIGAVAHGVKNAFQRVRGKKHPGGNGTRSRTTGQHHGRSHGSCHIGERSAQRQKERHRGRSCRLGPPGICIHFTG